MTAEPQTPPRGLTTRILEPSDGARAWRFLSRGGVKDVYIASQVWSGALQNRKSEGGPDFYGAFSNGILEAILYIGNGGLAVPAGDHPDAIAALGEVIEQRSTQLRALIGDKDAVGILVPFMERSAIRPHIDVLELFLEVDPATIDSSRNAPELRSATLEDLELVALASSRAHHEEMGEDPLATNPTAFMGRVARQIIEEKVYIIREGETLVFKAELSAKCPIGAQISGVFTHPDFRGKGLATRGTAELTRRTMKDAPQCCLFVRQDNVVARKVYEKIGYRHTRDFRTLFIAKEKARA